MRKRNRSYWSFKDYVKSALALASGLVLAYSMDRIPVSGSESRLRSEDSRLERIVEASERDDSKKDSPSEEITSSNDLYREFSETNENIPSKIYQKTKRKNVKNQKKPTRFALIGKPEVSYVQNIPDHNFNRVELAPKSDENFDRNLIGRIQRTERWANIIHAVEDFYAIPRDLIYAEIMHESYGDILQPNASDDGGLGLIHFQPGTARAYGLDVFGNSKNMGRDTKHGKSLAKMMQDCGYDVPCVLKEDDRAHPIIVIDAIARYLRDGYDRKGTWWGAVRTINPGQGNYAHKIFGIRSNISRLRKVAEADFNRRNAGKVDGFGHPMTYNHYISTFKKTNDQNYQLDTYRKIMRERGRR